MIKCIIKTIVILAISTVAIDGYATPYVYYVMLGLLTLILLKNCGLYFEESMYKAAMSNIISEKIAKFSGTEEDRKVAKNKLDELLDRYDIMLHGKDFLNEILRKTTV